MKLRTVFALAALLIAGPALAAGDYPDRTVTIVVPWSPGGVVDVAARTVADALSERWGSEVVVENRTGGLGFVGATSVARSAPDGYTLLMAESSLNNILPLLMDDIPYNIKTDLRPVIPVSDTPLALVARSDAPFDSAAEFIAYAQANPGELTYSSAGNGSLNHLLAEMINAQAGIDVRHIPYGGGAPAATAVAGGEVDVGVLTVSSAGSFVQTGDIKILAVAAADRLESHPDIPALSEAGVSGPAVGQWAGLFAPASVSDEIVAFLNAEITDVLNTDSIRAAFAERTARTIPMPSEDFAAMLADITEQFGSVIESANIVLE